MCVGPARPNSDGASGTNIIHTDEDWDSCLAFGKDRLTRRTEGGKVTPALHLLVSAPASHDVDAIEDDPSTTFEKGRTVRHCTLAACWPVDRSLRAAVTPSVGDRSKVLA